MCQSQGDLTGEMAEEIRRPRALGVWVREARAFQDTDATCVGVGHISRRPFKRSSFKSPFLSLGRQLRNYYSHFSGEENESPKGE